MGGMIDLQVATAAKTEADKTTQSELSTPPPATMGAEAPAEVATAAAAGAAPAARQRAPGQWELALEARKPRS